MMLKFNIFSFTFTSRIVGPSYHLCALLVLGHQWWQWMDLCMSSEVVLHMMPSQRPPPWTVWSVTTRRLAHGLRCPPCPLGVVRRGSLCCDNIPIDLIHKSQTAPVLYPTMLHSEQKCTHFCSELSIVGYGTGAFWDLWNCSIIWSVTTVWFRIKFKFFIAIHINMI